MVHPETRKLVIDPKRYKAVQIYYDGIDNDLPNEEIANTLNNLGYRTLKGRKFTANSFATWADNRKYRGDYVFDVSAPKDEEGKRNTNNKKPIEQQVIIPNAIPAIIQPDQWDRVYAKSRCENVNPEG